MRFRVFRSGVSFGRKKDRQCIGIGLTVKLHHVSAMTLPSGPSSPTEFVLSLRIICLLKKIANKRALLICVVLLRGVLNNRDHSWFLRSVGANKQHMELGPLSVSVASKSYTTKLIINDNKGSHNGTGLIKGRLYPKGKIPMRDLGLEVAFFTFSCAFEWRVLMKRL